MCSWKSCLLVLVVCVFIEGYSTAIDSPPQSLNSLKSSDISSTQDHAIRTFEKGLLKMFGLSSRPRPKKKVHIPQYILDLYEQAVEANREIYTPYEDDLDEEYYKLQGHKRSSRRRHPFAGKTIRSFYHRDGKDTDYRQSRKNRNKRSLLQDPQEETDHSQVLQFDVSNVGTDEHLLGAELRLFRKNHTSPNSVKYRIGVYDVIKPASEHREAVSRLIDTRIVDSSRTQWETFDVNPAVERWRKAPHSNHGLHIHITPTDSQSRDPATHVRLRRSVTSSDDQWLEEQPFLVTYSEDKNSRKKNSKRTRRGAKNKRKRSRSNSRKRKKDECRRHALYVDFSDVGWDDWIVAPPGYRAYFCQGECGFPLPEYLNATNHAIVQTLVHSVNPDAVPRPCCVPTKLSPISMLYLDEHEKVTLKNYQDMVVEGCGCR